MRKILLLAFFAAVSASYIWLHEPWRDEAQAWLIVREAPDFGTLIRLMGYEGTPSLWHLLLRPFALAGAPFVTVQILHVFLALLTAAVVIFFAPFSLTEKAVILFGYYLSYEYNAIARSYVLMALLAFLIAAQDAKRFEKPLLRALLLALLANTSTHGFVLAGAFALSDFIELVQDGKRAPWARIVPAALLLFSGALLAVWQIRPPADLLPQLKGWDISLTLSHIGKVPNAVVSAFLPVPPLRPSFWNFKILYDLHPALRLIGIPLFFLTLWVFPKASRSRRIYVIASLGLFAIFFFKHSGQNRHHGVIYLTFLTCLWIQGSVTPTRRLFVTSLWTLHVAAALIAIIYDATQPFSRARDTAHYLQQHQAAAISEKTIAAAVSPLASAILPHLPAGTEFFYLDRTPTGAYGSYVIWNTDLKPLPPELCALTDKLQGFAQRRQKNNILVILPTAVDATAPCAAGFQKQVAFEGAIVPDENNYIYSWQNREVNP